MVSYFHVCPIPLEVGSVILPGNFGRVIDKYRIKDLNALAARELSFEIIRIKHFPERPSRLTSIFLFPTIGHAQEFIKRHAFTSLIYEVAIQSDANIFHGDMSLIDFPIPGDELPAIPVYMNLASRYWRGIDSISASSEFIADCSARIIKFHDPR